MEKDIHNKNEEVVKSTNTNKTFTQEQLDSIVKNRLADQKAKMQLEAIKNEEFNSLKEKANQYDALQVELKQAELKAKITELGVKPELVNKAIKLLDLSRDIDTQVNEEILTIPGFANITNESPKINLGVRGVEKAKSNNESKKDNSFIEHLI